MTKEQLQAENERLGKEVAALRTLLAAVRDLADVPRPADLADSAKCDYAAGRRIDLIAVHADPDCNGRPARTATLHSSAKELRKEAARPLGYAPKAAEPETVPWPTGLCGHAVTPGAWSQGFATCRECLSDRTPAGVALYDRATAGEQLSGGLLDGTGPLA